MITEKNPVRLAILISGSGSTAEVIIKASQKGGFLYNKIKPVVVISSRSDAPGIGKAQKLEVPVEVVERKDFPKGPEGAEQFGHTLLGKLQKYNLDYVSQNGWLPKTPEVLIFLHEGRIFNQHPGPLDPDNLDLTGQPLHFGGPGMHGLAVPAAVLKFQQLSGRVFPDEATIHRVGVAVDSGTVFARREVPIFSGDIPEFLASRILPVEHKLQLVFWRDVYEGHIIELHRQEPLIKPPEVEFLRQAIIYARQQYPNG